MRATSYLAVLGLGLASCASDSTPEPTPILHEETGVQVVTGNPTCNELGYGAFSFKLDPADGGTYSLDGLNSITLVTDRIHADWSASITIDAVIVKGGPTANVYLYDPEAGSGTGLSSPINESTGTPYAISHVEFCFDYELAVGKTAHASFTRTYAWSIDKTATLSAVTLATGQVLVIPYTVAVAITGFVDSDWAADGTITIHNPAPFGTTVTRIDDALDDLPIAVDCPFALPYELGAGATVTCAYAAALPDGTNGVNSVTVATDPDRDVGPGSATAAVDFGTATMATRDACIDVCDDRAGSLGEACESRSFSYNLTVGPYETCGTSETFTNTATYAACDTGTTGSDCWAIAVTVPPCDLGCTLTPGYWKTHSAYGPAPTDATWLLLSDGPDTTFFVSGESYYQVLWTSSSQGVYYTLARAFIAAQLNQLDGASGTAIASEYTDAKALLESVTPMALASLEETDALVVRALADATALDGYNNGVTGPGHCTE